MASRKDFASKKRSAKPPTRKAPNRRAKVAPTPASAPAPEAKKSPWKLVLFSILAITTVVFILQQLSNIDPREIREAGISALIEANNLEEETTVAEPTADSQVVVDKDQAANTAKPTAEKPAVVIKNNNIPISEKSTVAKQKEPYQFYKILAENSVETETIEAYKFTPKTAKLKHQTLLQTGSFRQQKDAERMKVRLLLNNLPGVKVSKVSAANGTWYRVRTGPFITFNSLKSALIKLNKLNITPLQIPLG